MIQPQGPRTLLTVLFACLLLLATGGCQMLQRMGRQDASASPQPARATKTQPKPAPAEPRPATSPAKEVQPEPAPAPRPKYTRADAFAALQNAGVKPLDRGSLGYYMDVQEAKLRQQLRHTPVSVVRDGTAIVVTLPVSVTFESGQTAVSSGFYDALNSIALVLKEYNRTIVSLDGYTDSSGGAALNLDLSRRRAQSVADYFVRQGIRRPRLVVGGHGEADPVASNASADGRARNRRVELRIIPLVTA